MRTSLGKAGGRARHGRVYLTHTLIFKGGRKERRR